MGHKWEFARADKVSESGLWICIYCSNCNYLDILQFDALELLTHPNPAELLRKIKFYLAKKAVKGPTCEERSKEQKHNNVS